jgi:hypothetical protein
MPHAAPLGVVEAGLDGDDLADAQGAAGGADPRGFVDLQAEAVAGAVEEGVGRVGV